MKSVRASFSFNNPPIKGHTLLRNDQWGSCIIVLSSTIQANTDSVIEETNESLNIPLLLIYMFSLRSAITGALQTKTPRFWYLVIARNIAGPDDTQHPIRVISPCRLSTTKTIWSVFPFDSTRLCFSSATACATEQITLKKPEIISQQSLVKRHYERLCSVNVHSGITKLWPLERSMVIGIYMSHEWASKEQGTPILYSLFSKDLRLWLI